MQLCGNFRVSIQKVPLESMSAHVDCRKTQSHSKCDSLQIAPPWRRIYGQLSCKSGCTIQCAWHKGTGHVHSYAALESQSDQVQDGISTDAHAWVLLHHVTHLMCWHAQPFPIIQSLPKLVTTQNSSSCLHEAVLCRTGLRGQVHIRSAHPTLSMPARRCAHDSRLPSRIQRLECQALRLTPQAPWAVSLVWPELAPPAATVQSQPALMGASTKVETPTCATELQESDLSFLLWLGSHASLHQTHVSLATAASLAASSKSAVPSITTEIVLRFPLQDASLPPGSGCPQPEAIRMHVDLPRGCQTLHPRLLLSRIMPAMRSVAQRGGDAPPG